MFDRLNGVEMNIRELEGVCRCIGDEIELLDDRLKMYEGRYEGRYEGMKELLNLCMLYSIPMVGFTIYMLNKQYE